MKEERVGREEGDECICGIPVSRALNTPLTVCLLCRRYCRVGVVCFFFSSCN